MREINIKELQINPMTIFGDDWLALSAGNKESGVGTMCIAWGHLGSLWERETHANRLPTAVCYVRSSRHTKEFMDKEELFTLCSFDPKYKKALGYLGSHSGRDGDKITPAGLTPVYADGTVYFAEAKLVCICRKLYHAPLMEEGFVDKGLIDFNYPQKDFHEMYVGEIVKTLISKEG